MKLVPNARRIALGSFSMWSIYLGILLLWVPELLWLFWNVETDPVNMWIAANVLLIGGALGRIIDQGMS